MKLAITGAGGYIGERLTRTAIRQGHEVFSLSRTKPRIDSAQWIHFDLEQAEPIMLPPGITAVIHLAAFTGTGAADRQKEFKSAIELIEAARRSNADFIFMSSQTARPDAPTGYGLSKWEIERKVLATGGLVVRPGQVYGGDERALFGTLVSMVRRYPVIPDFLPAPRIQPVHVDDLVQVLLRLVEQHHRAGPDLFCIGAPMPIGFTEFLQCIARDRVGHYRPSLPVPTALIRIAHRAFSGLPGIGPLLSRLASLFDLPSMESRDDLERLQISLRPLADGMARSGRGRRRQLLREGRSLLGHVLRVPPDASLMKRYVLAVERLSNGRSLMLPDLVLHFPGLLDMFRSVPTPEGMRAAALAWRIHAAVMIAEASPQGAQRFLGNVTGIGKPHGLAKITLSLLSGACLRALALVLKPILRAPDRLRESGH